MKIKLFADTSGLATIRTLAKDDRISGFTTNPSLMRGAGIRNYQEFAADVLSEVQGKPVSFEVIADDDYNMVRQAKLISSWGENVYAKMPVTNSKGDPTLGLISGLASQNIKLNVTAVMELWDVWRVSQMLRHGPPSIISIFCGRIADTGVDPVPFMEAAAAMVKLYPNVELLWASTRELYNIFQAEKTGCHIITVGPELLLKLPLIGKNLKEYSLETCKQFRDDAVRAGFVL